MYNLVPAASPELIDFLFKHRLNKSTLKLLQSQYDTIEIVYKDVMTQLRDDPPASASNGLCALI